MLEKDIFAGFGGQGVLLMGQLLAYAAMIEDKQVSWLPSYGPEMRGGTANCSVIISDKQVASPIVDYPTALIVMNRPSLDRFENIIVPGGKLFINSSIIDRKAIREDIEAFYVPCNDIALEMGDARVANVIMLGAYQAVTNSVSIESLMDALLNKLGERKAHLMPINREAFARGAAIVK